MAQSSSNPTEALVDLADGLCTFPDDVATTLQRILPDLVFMEDEEVLNKFQCRSCWQIALRTHMTDCHHLLCRPCFENVLLKNCPVDGCTNPKVCDEGKSKTKAQTGLRELKVRCLHHEYGCEEIISLENLLDHKAICKYRPENLLPKLWKPNILKDNVYIEQLQKDLNVLRKVVQDMKKEINLIKEELLQKTEELSQIRHNEKGFTSDITLLQEQLLKLKNLQEMDIKMLINGAVVEQWNLQRDAWMKDAREYLKTQTDQQKMDIITEISTVLTRQLVKDEAVLGSTLHDKIKSDNVEMLTKHIKELEERIQMQLEEISTSMKHACSEELQKKMDELCKDVNDKQDTIVQEANLKIEKCLQAIDHFKTQTEDSLNHKMESEDLERFVLYSCVNPSDRARWVERALKTRRTEFVWKVTGVQSLLQRWRNEGKGHLLSDVFITKEFGFKIRARLQYKLLARGLFDIRPGVDLYFEFVDEEAPPTHPSIYLHRRTFVLMDQSQGSGPKRDMIHIHEPGYGKDVAQGWTKGFSGWPWFVLMKWLEGGAPYVVNDALCIRILIDPLSVLLKSFVSDDGTLLWTIDNYSKKEKDLQDGVCKSLYSDSFYSSSRGFRMKLRYKIHSVEDLIMGVAFLRGEWDHSLPRGFLHKTTVTILDQSDSKQKNHLIRTMESNMADGYWMDAIPRSKVESGPYLKGDSLLVKVIVEPKQ